MARIEWVRSRLENWAIWSDREARGGLGFARSAVFLADRVDLPLEARLPVDEIDAAKTDQAVSSLKLSHPDIHRTIELMYLHGIGAIATGRALGCGRSTVLARLERADRLLARWFSDRAERQAAAKKSFTT